MGIRQVLARDVRVVDLAPGEAQDIRPDDVRVGIALCLRERLPGAARICPRATSGQHELRVVCVDRIELVEYFRPLERELQGVEAECLGEFQNRNVLRPERDSHREHHHRARASDHMIAGAGAVVVFAVAVALGAQHVPILKLSQTLRLNPLQLALERAKVFDQLDPIYTDNPQFMLTGSGPGTYSSRAWQTFAKAESNSHSNVVGSYVLSLTGGEVYDTDVSRKYLPDPHLTQNTVSGSYAVTSPFTSYVSIPTEVGL